VAQRWVDRLPQNFPAGRTEIDDALGAVDLGSLTSDPGDHHVCALAIERAGAVAFAEKARAG